MPMYMEGDGGGGDDGLVGHGVCEGSVGGVNA